MRTKMATRKMTMSFEVFKWLDLILLKMHWACNDGRNGSFEAMKVFSRQDRQQWNVATREQDARVEQAPLRGRYS
jgi:hypothetical protein